ncbi:MAG: hypothetical protein ACR2PL_25055 [Dehalococcoidia bacterium]
MTSETQEILILRDEAGAYYAILRRTLEHYRVPDEGRPDVEQLLGRADVCGFGSDSAAGQLPSSSLRPLGLYSVPLGDLT